MRFKAYKVSQTITRNLKADRYLQFLFAPPKNGVKRFDYPSLLQCVIIVLYAHKKEIYDEINSYSEEKTKSRHCFE